jgi:hypothetical protein
MFCVFLNVRYSNPKLMHVGHQYVASNFDPSTLKGLVAVDAYHISPDKGLGIFTFDNQINLEKHIPVLKDFFKDYEDRFSCKTSIETGIVNEELDYKANIKR